MGTATKYRTHTTGDIDSAIEGESIRLCGWVHRRRDHGGLLFVDVRDRYGIVQCVVTPDDASQEMISVVESLRAEDVVAIEGVVSSRPEANVNPELASGEVEVRIDGCAVLARAETPPFPVDSEKEEGEIGEDVRLRYRYVDLRRKPLVEALGLRHTVALETRKYLDDLGFWEIETPILTRRTPEGARDYLVPSRVHHGRFYALPQSPQLYKQLLMVAGYDRYFQIARCFRDEDLRADRQPEFTQIDLEMSFVGAEDVLGVVTGLFEHLFRTCLDRELGPVPRLSYEEAWSRFGSDKPDLRIEPELSDVTEVFAGSGFRVFDGVVEEGGSIIAIRVPEQSDVSRSAIDRWTDVVRASGAKGLVWARHETDGWRTSIDKFVDASRWDRAAGITDAAPGDLLLVVADDTRAAQTTLGALRVHLAGELGWRKTGLSLVWVVDFPLFEPGPNGEVLPSHHPFTSPRGGLEALDADDPFTIVSEAYDLVLNGYELGSGSVRIHDRSTQERVFEMLGIDAEEARDRFGFLLDGLQHGAPPHAGIALGLDRIAMLFSDRRSLRDVIAFPKTTSATGLLEGAPSEIDPGDLEALAIRVEPDEGRPGPS